LALAVRRCLAFTVLIAANGASSAAQERLEFKTFVDMTPAELARQVRELKHLTPASSQEMLPEILQRVGSTVADFFDNFSNTTSLEHLSSTVDVPGERREFHYDARLNYVALVKAGGDKTRLEEYRTNPKGKVVQLLSLQTVVTLGFVSMTVHLHPSFQPDSRFSYLGREEVDRQDAYVVAFAQRPGVARRTSLVASSGRTANELVQGVAWIDPVNFRVLRLRTDLERPDPTVNLARETTQIEYFGVTFKQGGKSLWLPRQVNVRGQIGKYAYDNRHRYSDYRLFIVRTGESTSHDQRN
jgi:hypothetical protein